MCWLYLGQDVSGAPVPSDLGSTMVIQDYNAFFHVMSNNTSNSYLIARAIFDIIPRSGDIIFSTEGSIKQMERQMLGTSDTLIISGPLQKSQLIGRHV